MNAMKPENKDVAPLKQVLQGKAAEDFISKVGSLKLGDVLSLSSPLPGLSETRVIAKLVERTGTHGYVFDMLWFNTYVGTAKAWLYPKEMKAELEVNV